MGIPAAKIFDLAETFSCNPKWLATKKGQMHDDNQNPFNLDWSKWTLDKVEHAKEVEVLTDAEFKTQKRVFKALVESAKDRKKQDQ